MTEFFPPSFKTPEAKEDVLAWISTLPIDAQDAKQLLLSWAADTGVSLTAEEIRAAIPGLQEDEGITT